MIFMICVLVIVVSFTKWLNFLVSGTENLAGILVLLPPSFPLIDL